jgi:single-stranded-DNA-specific exonuclease
MGDAAEAFALLTATDFAAAREQAQRLDASNRERREAVDVAVENARALVDPALPVAIAVGAFAPGIAGLVAGRLSEATRRPWVVLEQGEEFCRGSARSPDGFHLAQALDACADLLVKYGGHAQAAGLTLRTAALPAFETRFQALARTALGEQPVQARRHVDGELSLREVNWTLAQDLQSLEPCGMGNPPALFLTHGVEVREARPLSNGGLSVRLAAGGLPLRGYLRGVPADALRVGSRIDVVYGVERREWNGRVLVELRVADYRPAQQASGP